MVVFMSYLIFGSSVIGQSHIAMKRGIDDAYGFLQKDDSAILIVADGAGSAKYSKYGAEKIVDSFKYKFESSDYKSCPEKFIIETTEYARNEIEKMASNGLDNIKKEYIKSYKDFASTMIVVLAIGNKWYAGHIGDGASVRSYNNKFDIISPPYESEYVNETVFITSDNYKEFLNITSGDNFNEIYAFTDGIQRGVIDVNNGIQKPFEPFFKYLSNFALSVDNVDEASNNINDMLLNKFSEISDDDKTLVIMVNKGE